MRILLWFRNDLRLHDHEPLHRAVQQNAQQGAEIIPLYCFDPRQFGQTPFGFPKTGAYRAQFLIETVADLRKGLRIARQRSDHSPRANPKKKLQP